MRGASLVLGHQIDHWILNVAGWRQAWVNLSNDQIVLDFQSWHINSEFG